MTDQELLTWAEQQRAAADAVFNLVVAKNTAIADLQAANVRIQSINDELASMTASRDTARSELSKLTTERDALKATVTAQVAEIERLEATVTAQTAEIERLKSPEPADPMKEALQWILRPPAGKIHTGTIIAPDAVHHDVIVGKKAQFVHTYSKTLAEFQADLDRPHDGQMLVANCKPTAMNQTEWTAVAAGQRDAVLKGYADAIRAYARPMALVPYHEPENDGSGTAFDDAYRAAYEYVYRYMKEKAKLTNVVIGPNFMGFSSHMPRMERLCPAPQYMDFFAIDPYCHDATETLLTFGVMKGAAKAYYDFAQKKKPGVPVWWMEWGMDKPTAAARAAQVFTAAGLKELQDACPNLLGLFYWNEWLTPRTDPKKDYRLQNFPAVWKAFALLPQFNHPVPA